MIRLVCEKCDHVWYTANTRPNQKCGACEGNLRETELIAAKEIEERQEAVSKRDSESKVIHVSFK